MNRFRLRGWLAIVACLAIQATGYSSCILLSLGGGQGPAEGGKFYLSNHGTLRETAENTWHLAPYLAWCVGVSLVVTIVSVLAAILQYIRDDDYQEQADYTPVVGICVATMIVMHVVCDIVRPR